MGICGGNHLRRNHECKECKSKNPCQHAPLKCVNCGGKHEAVNPSCPNIRKEQKRQQENERQKDLSKNAGPEMPSSPPRPITIQSSPLLSSLPSLPSTPSVFRPRCSTGIAQMPSLTSDTLPLPEKSTTHQGKVPDQDDQMDVSEDIMSEIAVRTQEKEEEL